MSFIRRHGSKRGLELARDEVPQPLRVAFVNLLEKHRYRSDFLSFYALHENACRALRMRPYYAKEPFEAIESIVSTCSWDEFYEICEMAAKAIPEDVHVVVAPDFGLGLQPTGFVPKATYDFGPGLQPTRFVPNATLSVFVEELNELFGEEGVPWRMSDRKIVPAFPEEVDQVLDGASAAARQLTGQGVAVHLEKARRYLTPSHIDEENAVKEAVSAVEAAVKAKSGLGDFDDGLKLLKQQRLLADAWRPAVQALYQYASQEDQVRHGSPDLSELTYEEARDLVGLSAILTQHIAGLRDPVRAG